MKKLGIHLKLGYMAYSSQEAIEDYYLVCIKTFSRIGKGRDCAPFNLTYSNSRAGPTDSLVVVSSEEVAAKFIRYSMALAGST